MKRFMFFLIAMSVLLQACTAGILAPSEAQPSPTPYPAQPTLTPYPTQPAPATESATVIPTFTATIVPTATLAPTFTPVPTTGSGCDVLAVTNLSARADSLVNNTVVTLQVRDTNSCGRPLWYNETGVAKGANYTFDLEEGWTVVTASVTAQVHPEGGQATDYLDTPVLVICGPFKGDVGPYEGAVRVYPNEWVDNALSNEVLPIQRQQTGKPTLEPIYIGCGQ